MALLLVLGSATAGADEDGDTSVLDRVLKEERVTGWTRFDYFESSNSLDGAKDLFGGTAQLKALPKLGEAFDGKIEARFSAPDVRGREGEQPRGQLLEGYVTFHTSDADLRVGRQIIAWGRADGINPTDNLTPRNYRVLLPNDDDQRFGIWAARLNIYLPQSMTLTVFASPFFEPDDVPLPSDGPTFGLHRPSTSARNTVAAVKIDRTSDDLDWSLSYYRGFSLSPSVEQVSGNGVDLGYDRVDVIGTDLARNFGRFGVRSEVAYTLPSSDSIDPNMDRSRLFWVAGIDRTFLEDLNLNVQFLLRWMPGRTDPQQIQNESARTASNLNAVVGGQEGKTSPGFTFRVSDLWLNNSLKAELFGVFNVTQSDGYLRPLVTYDINDKVRVTAGANIYLGPSQTQYGLLAPDNGVFTEVRYGF